MRPAINDHTSHFPLMQHPGTMSACDPFDSWHSASVCLRFGILSAMRQLTYPHCLSSPQLRQTAYSSAQSDSRAKSYKLTTGDSLVGQVFVPLTTLSRGNANGPQQTLTVPMYSHSSTFGGGPGAAEGEAEETAGRCVFILTLISCRFS